MKISAEKLSHEIADKTMRAKGQDGEGLDPHVLQRRDENVTEANDLVRRRNGLGKIPSEEKGKPTHIFVLNVLEEFELTVGTFGEDGRAEGFHDLLDGDRCTCELVLCRTDKSCERGLREDGRLKDVPYEPECSWRGQGKQRNETEEETHPFRRVEDRHIWW